jgi:hypothetical protein
MELLSNNLLKDACPRDLQQAFAHRLASLLLQGIGQLFQKMPFTPSNQRFLFLAASDFFLRLTLGFS